ncbi:MAG: low molecular weight phosphotyrosine protein phosphatase [Planctomycetota bacterium]|nr:MAG: low molecular weight phosphotyrosine protein phosphatase [Planctomycetota bacterium]
MRIWRTIRFAFWYSLTGFTVRGPAGRGQLYSPSVATRRGLLFVCLGNICRSPLAEGVFAHLASEAGRGAAYRVDSAGTGAYHAGEPPDPRSADVARRHGVRLRGRARKVRRQDFEDFDLIIAMDGQNHRDLLRACPAPLQGKVRLLREWDPEGPGDVPDPYYGGPGGFETVYGIVRRCCEALLAELEA